MTAAFHVPATILLGGGARAQLADLVRRLGGRALLVTDAYLVRSGVVGWVEDQLRAAGVATAVFADVQPDPTVANVLTGLDALRAHSADVVVGLGGGSPIDAAKAIAILASNPPPLASYAGYHRIPRPGLPLVAVPTTAGTGSEATKVAVITDVERDVKMMLLDAHLLPRAAVVDYELTLTMPRPLTAHVGVDTLTHGLEAYVSRRANPLTDPLALSCIRLVADHLVAAYDDGDNRPARAAMATAALQGGMAFANSSVCLVHGMSRPLGAHFHVPHGLSNAVLLPDVTRYSLAAGLPRYAEAARTMGVAGPKDGDEVAGGKLVDYLEILNARLAVGRLRDAVRVSREEFETRLPALAEAALASGSPQNNPRVPTPDEIVDLYRIAW